MHACLGGPFLPFNLDFFPMKPVLNVELVSLMKPVSQLVSQVKLAVVYLP